MCSIPQHSQALQQLDNVTVSQHYFSEQVTRRVVCSEGTFDVRNLGVDEACSWQHKHANAFCSGVTSHSVTWQKVEMHMHFIIWPAPALTEVCRFKMKVDKARDLVSAASCKSFAFSRLQFGCSLSIDASTLRFSLLQLVPPHAFLQCSMCWPSTLVFLHAWFLARAFKCHMQRGE